MFTLIKELADRFIEFVLSMVKGETLEDQLTSALKSAIFLITVFGFVAVALLLNNINQRIELSDMEKGVEKVNLLFDTSEEGLLTSFIKINKVLSQRMEDTKQENVLLVKSNTHLIDESRWVKLQLVQVLDENQILKNNNKFLLEHCKLPELSPSEQQSRQN